MLSIYADQQGDAPLWQETQNIAIDAQGRYSLLLGATRAEGIPAALFAGAAAHWLGTVFERAGEVEGPRAADQCAVRPARGGKRTRSAGNRPAYLLAPAGNGGAGAQTAAAEAGGGTADVVLPFSPSM